MLLYSKISKQKLEKEEEFKGCEDAIKSIREIKNTMFSHAKRNSIEKHDFEKSIQALKSSVLTLGLDEQMFEESLKGTLLFLTSLIFLMNMEVYVSYI